jgi:hypothetical protein
MAKVTNVSGDDWEVPSLGLIVAAGETVEVDDADAAGFVDVDRWKVEKPSKASSKPKEG